MAGRWNRAACIVLLVLPACCFGGAGVVSEQDFDFGPIISRDLSLEGNVRYRALGPLWERQVRDDGGAFSAARPVYARVSETNTPRTLTEVAWPVSTFKLFRNEYYWRVITGFGHDFEADSESRYKNHIYPILFQGEAAGGEHYFAVFPVGGTIREFMGKDRIDFALFPLYARTQVNEFVTHDVLWPFVSWGRHDEGSRWRVFPFYGQSQQDGYWKRRFVMWPVWSSVEFEKDRGGGFILFPVTGYSRVDEEKTYWLVPPFFKWLQGPGHTQANLPWPFFQYESGPAERLYIWPVWGTRSSGSTKSSFFLWPVFHSSETVAAGRKTSAFRAVPLVVAEKTVMTEGGSAGEVESRYFKLWPLFSYRREGEVSRLRSLELWPAKNSGPIDRNFAPLWTIYNREKAGEASDTELLWGLYRNRKGADGDKSFSIFPLYSRKRMADASEFSSWNVLAGLFGREVNDGVRRWRVLYFMHFGNRKVEAE